MGKDEKKMPWRSEELGDIIGDNQFYDEKERSDNPECPCKCHVYPIGCQHCKPLNQTHHKETVEEILFNYELEVSSIEKKLGRGSLIPQEAEKRIGEQQKIAIQAINNWHERELQAEILRLMYE